MKKVMITTMNFLRTTALLLFILLIYSDSAAQNFIGVKSGFHFSRYEVGYNSGTAFEETGIIWGYDFGLNLNTKIYKGFELRSELNMVQKGGGWGEKLKLNVVELALMATYQVPIKRFSVYANFGGFIGHLVSGKLVHLASGRKKDFVLDPRFYNRWDRGIAVGGGVKYNFSKSYIFLESRYRYSLTFFRDDPVFSATLFDESELPLIDYYRVTKRLYGMGLNFGYAHKF